MTSMYNNLDNLLVSIAIKSHGYISGLTEMQFALALLPDDRLTCNDIQVTEISKRADMPTNIISDLLFIVTHPQRVRNRLNIVHHYMTMHQGAAVIFYLG